jgi:tRNA(fMet)-specific endonuclease VapC
MTHLIDSNVCVVYLRSGGVGVLADRVRAAGPSTIALCSVVVAELLFGALRNQRVAHNLNEIRVFASGFPSLPFDDAAGLRYA